MYEGVKGWLIQLRIIVKEINSKIQKYCASQMNLYFIRAVPIGIASHRAQITFMES